MAAGGPGDHWRTDLLSWDAGAFGEPVDELIREIHALGGQRVLDDESELGRRLGRLWPRWGTPDRQALAELVPVLTGLRDQLRQQAIDRGWEVD